MRYVALFFFLIASALGVAPASSQGVPKSFQPNICGTVTTTSAPVCVNDGNGGNPQWGTINPTAHTFSLNVPTLAMGAPISGCSNNGGLLYNVSNTLGCSAVITTDGSRILLGDGTAAAPSLSFVSAPDYGFLKIGGSVYFTQVNVLRSRFTSTGIYVGSAARYGFSSTTSAGGAEDTAIARNAAGVVEINNSTNGVFGDLRVKNVVANNSGIYSWSGQSQLTSPADGNILATNAAGNSFGLLQLGGTTSAYPAIKRNGLQVDFRLADDTAYANVVLGALTTGSTINAGSNITAPATASYFFNGRSRISSPIDGNITLGNNAATTFGLLQFGGTTSAFPAWKRSGATIQARLADDSADAGITAGLVTATGFTTGGDVTAGAGASFVHSGRSRVMSPADGNTLLTNNAQSAFGLLQLGGTTSAYPAIKRSGATLAARVADDTADATVTALTQAGADNSNKVATTAFVQTNFAGKQPTNANLTALSGLTGAADKVAYFTGPGAMSLADMTSFARTLNGSVDSAAFMTALGFQFSLGTNGYIKFPNGLMFQWGTATGGTGLVDCVFPVAFTTAVYGVQFTPQTNNGDVRSIVQFVTPILLNRAQAYRRAIVGGSPVDDGTDVLWYAWGV